MPLVIRAWLFLSTILAPLIHFCAKWMHLRQGIAPLRFQERMGQATADRGDGRWVWVHAASLGEVSQTRDLINSLIEEHGFNVLVTTFSGSGAVWVARELPKAVHQFVPLDTPVAVDRFLKTWRPELGVFIEGDIWPRLVLTAARHNVPLALLNARPSKSRDKRPAVFAALLSQFRAITCKSEQVAADIARLGIAQQQVHVFGDLRACALPPSVDSEAVSTLSDQIANRPVWIAASTHADDEEAVAQACKIVFAAVPECLLIWAPRHPDRAPAILERLDGLATRQRSNSEAITPETQVYLADTLGELGSIYSCSKVVFLGGSFGDEGGHNPYEPACFGCFLLTGPKVRNHVDGFNALAAAGASAEVADGTALAALVIDLLNTNDAGSRGEKGRALVAASGDASAKTIVLLRDLLKA